MSWSVHRDHINSLLSYYLSHSVCYLAKIWNKLRLRVCGLKRTLASSWPFVSSYLPPRSSATPQISSSARGRCSFLWWGGCQSTTLVWPPHSGRQLWNERTKSRCGRQSVNLTWCLQPAAKKEKDQLDVEENHCAGASFVTSQSSTTSRNWTLLF